MRPTMIAEIASTAASAHVYRMVRRVRSDTSVRLAPLAEHVALAAQRVDQPGAAVCLELGAQPRDIHIDDVARRVVALIPDVTRDLRTIERLARMAHEQLEHQVLASGERELAAGARAGAACGVESHIVHLEDRWPGARRPAQQRSHPRRELLEGEGLHEVVVGA